ncbi:MAG: hypothetical protein OEY23_20570, partial [Acidimicrobiia bacterium]|nr:hypothetical protein [Acidimicrobiia bacterium]
MLGADLQPAKVQLVVDLRQGGGGADRGDDVETGGAERTAPDQGGLGGHRREDGLGAGVDEAATALPVEGAQDALVVGVQPEREGAAFHGERDELGVQHAELSFE